ncbi:hypothetical protein E2C01_011403 [Portunus trituberculatus]|uniref:Uncharacterized protein n=1 Tax=Portunus trituberculatus TaxID=210409 RepID=A0A5B7DB74_PORTR|nr:hypothetical protein [Portunus trituberculatus]
MERNRILSPSTTVSTEEQRKHLDFAIVFTKDLPCHPPGIPSPASGVTLRLLASISGGEATPEVPSVTASVSCHIFDSGDTLNVVQLFTGSLLMPVSSHERNYISKHFIAVLD